MKLLTSTLFAVLALGLAVPAWASQPLLSPSELQAIVDQPDVQVIDIRPATQYAAGHIPGAVSAPYPQWRGPANNPGQLPPVKELAALVQNLGLTDDTHAVVVSTGKNASAFGGSARVYWTLKYLGLTNLSILNGGYNAWQQASLPLSENTPSVTPTSYQVQLDSSIIATTQDVAAQIGNPDTRLVDARPHSYYVGDKKSSVVPVAGTIKGAVNVEQGSWFKPGSSVFVAPDKARKIANQTLDNEASETISFCNTGHWAATDWFALSEVAGVKNVRLYPESLAAWAQDSSLPMENVPSRGSQILRKIGGLFE